MDIKILNKYVIPDISKIIIKYFGHNYSDVISTDDYIPYHVIEELKYIEQHMKKCVNHSFNKWVEYEGLYYCVSDIKGMRMKRKRKKKAYRRCIKKL